MEAVALVVGEALVDVVEAADGSVVEWPGGSAANTAVALARLGRPVALATSYGDDAHGRLLADHLGSSGVGRAAEPHVLARTSVAQARIGADGAASYDFDLEWQLGPVDVPLVHVLHIGSLAPLLEPGASAVRALVERLAPTTTVSYDLNVRPAITGTGPEVQERVEWMARHADLVKASDEDLAAIWPDLDEGGAVERLEALGAVGVVVTRGAGGATWHGSRRTGAGRDGREHTSASGSSLAPQVEVVDTIGAGDTFLAGLLDALWDHLGDGGRERLATLEPEEWGAAVAHASRCAAITVSRRGADPPWRSELD